MIRKSQLFLAVAAFAGMNVAMAACNTSQWGQGSPPSGAVVGTPIAGDPVATGTGGDNTEIARYSGKCGLGASAAGQYVQDGLPSAEDGYISRFYVKPNITTGEAVVFQAMVDAAPDYPLIRITYDGAAQQFKFYGSNGTPGSILGTVPAIAGKRDRWYAIETNYNRGAGTNTGTLSISVLGNRNLAPEAGTPATANLSGITINTAGQGVDFVQFGWISGGTGAGVTVDAFESRRSTAIGRLQRGNANGSDAVCNTDDIVAAALDANAILGGDPAGLANGQPDCTEDGQVNANDLVCIALIANYDLGEDTVCGATP